MSLSPVSALPNVRVLGRHLPGQEPLTLFYTASGLECRFTGSELWLELAADYELFEPWISVELNGAWISRFPVNRGQSEICLFRGMTPGPAKHVRVLKDVQAMRDDPRHLLQITGLRHEGGAFVPLPAPRLRLEFVGDSITSGEGAIGAVEEQDWIPAFFSAENHYGRMTADALGAEYRIVSQSGWGVCTGWDNDPRHAIPPLYRQICGAADGPRNEALGAGRPYDFSGWPAGAVIVNLGTNDANALRNPPWRDPADGSLHPCPGLQELERCAAEFLETLRACNPGALLVWAYGMLGSSAQDGGVQQALESAVARYCAASGDCRARFLLLPDTAPGTFGARSHPGAASHRRAAETLTAFLQQELAL